MAHNHLMGNQPQLSLNPGVSAGSQQHNVISQRGQTIAPPPKSSFQMPSIPMGQLSHLQQQSQLVNNYHKQMSSEISSVHQYSSPLGNLPTQNGNYQNMTGSSSHSSLGLDNTQLSIQQQRHQYQQQQQPPPIQPPIHPPTQHHHYQSPPSLSQPLQQSQPSQQQNLLQTLQQQHHHHLHQHHQQIPAQQKQAPHQPSYQQQHLQIQQQLQQQNLHQQQRYQKQQQQQQQQPKQILQHPPNTPKTHQSIQTPPSYYHQEPTKPATITNGHAAAATAEDKREISTKNEEKSENEPSQGSSNSVTEKQCLANTKEKTPMCLINELARSNKISHQYTLVDEQGPAHKKTFYVKLKLSDEEYSASGDSIKKAQHAAAAIALVETKYPHPPPKPARVNETIQDETGEEHITPTVELNALAMKRGETAVYKSIEPQQPPFYQQPGMDFRGLYNQRYHYMRANRDPHYYSNGVLWPLRYNYTRMSRAFYVSLRVGHREFIGDGPTRQAARHNAAQKALRILKNLPVQNSPKKDPEETNLEINDILKSEISLVHEIALHRNMSVTFEVIRESGPPHMKNFITKCIVGDKVTEGEGNSKKTSKKKAAELMLEELRKLPPLPAVAFLKPKAKIQINKKKNRNLIKSELQQQKADPNYGVGINPISRLIQIMQAQKKKEPVYTLIAEKGLPRRREFVMQVEAENQTCTGSGPNKKLAKRSAAEAMLQLLGFTKPSPQPAKSSIKHPASSENNQNGDKKVTFVEGDAQTADNGDKVPSPTTPTQRVPGLLHIPTNTKPALSISAASSTNTSASQAKETGQVNLSNILKPNLRPEVQLTKLCKALGYHLEIDDFTKKHPDGTLHIARITLGQEQGQTFHGSSTSLESSRDMAASDALKVLLAKVKDVHPGGDGPLVRKDHLNRSSPIVKKDIGK